jgi:hypothetical protein
LINEAEGMTTMATMTNEEILEAIGNKTVVELAELIETF